ncbi:50S ribosome-binding GTPase [Candidatus Woesearchaeota archaeon]|jgi:nucleolar GTP-binding protein|nr:50S ribosome-binding GTPase [Candidatus Woesearchaeota archaeon]
MNFQGLAKIEKHEWYIDLAFRNATKKAKDIKSQMRRTPYTIKRAEVAKISEIRRTLRRHLDIILKSFPSIDGMNEFYQELVRATLEYAQLKKSLGAIRWAQQKIEHFSDVYSNKVKRCGDFKKMTHYSREYYGRISSVMRQVKKPLQYLETSRKVMRDFPSVKEKLFTIAIAGFPNVGKTTLLAKLTTSKPEIAAYPFTTRKLNIGYATIKNHKVQFIDTPGTLNRFEKMNSIEKQAHLAIKYCADLIIFVFDISDQTYDEEKQGKLLNKLKKSGKDTLIYLSKTDLAGKEKTGLSKAAISKKYPFIKAVATDPKDLKHRIAL